MLVYRAIKAAVGVVRSIQTGLLAASWFAADCADYAGNKAKRIAHAVLDKREAQSMARVSNARTAVENASVALEDAILDFELDCDDIAIERTIIDREVL